MDPLLLDMLREIRDEQILMRGDITQIKMWQAERKGERSASKWIFGTASGAAGAVLTMLVAWLTRKG